MIKKVFLDSDVILDFLLERKPFFSSAFEIFNLAANHQIHLVTSSLAFANIYYIFQKEMSDLEARKSLRKLQIIVDVLNVDGKMINLALDSVFKDFEDAIQYYCALEEQVEALITRNKKDYKEAEMAIMSPYEFLSAVDKLEN